MHTAHCPTNQREKVLVECGALHVGVEAIERRKSIENIKVATLESVCGGGGNHLDFLIFKNFLFPSEHFI